ncbi:TetR/AcrR family transcriptional regulator [Iamia sp. SCSIO 61187]|uniref:TetR/AcrR family transcriptional regulator n=1 Tax=Iamia sp. SCSIO 61187 TaxID=2722752 RepID=UPI001C62DB95|nr:TetR family transcriptional regulator [Iamia sp. SCSIO 61187]QYG93290.1 TetR/AcrR family transcriptional regulator [Iamia sp. SCSIO 61187]
MPAAPTAAGAHRWVGVPPAERRAERRRLLVEAAFELLGTEGDAATTVRAVCGATRLNPRYFYESFADRDALLVAVYDQQVAELGALLAARLADVGDDEEAFTRTGVETVVRFVAEDPRRARVLYTEALGNEALARRRLTTLHDVGLALTELGRERHGPPPPGETIGLVAAPMLVGGLTETIVAWLDGHLDVTLDQLVADTTALFTATTAATRQITARRRSS